MPITVSKQSAVTKKFFLLCLLALLLSYRGADAQSLGLSYSDFIPIQSSESASAFRTYPLPPGTWTVAASYDYEGTSTSSIRPKFRHLFLTQVTDKKLIGAIEIQAHIGAFRGGWSDNPCKRQSLDNYYNDYGTRLWTQRCVSVKNRIILDKDNKISSQTRRSLGDVKYSNSTIQIGYHEQDRNGGYLVFKTFIYPDVYGIENPTARSESESPFHPDKISEDSKKNTFMGKVSSYADLVAESLHAAFKGGQTPPLPQLMPPLTPDRSHASKPNSSSIENRLLRLKQAYEEGLVSDEEYKVKRAKIIGEL